MNWQKLEFELDKLVEQIKTKPDCIVGIVRGGIIPARILTSKLGVESMFCINIQKQDSARRVVSEILSDISGQNILLVEDALESGKSLLVAKEYLEAKGASVQTLAIYIQPNSTIKPDYYIEIKQELPKFPWE